MGNFELPRTHINPDVPFDEEVAASKGLAFHQHCYAMLELNARSAKVLYYEDRDGGKLVYAEEI
jgi:hypothetical protein